MALERLSVTPTPTPTPCSLDARLDLGALCVAQCSGEGAITCYRIDRAGNAPNQTAHVTLGIPTGDPSTGNPLDPSVPLEATGDVGIHPFVNVKHVQFTPDGSALIAAYFDRGLEVYPTLRYSNGGVVLSRPCTAWAWATPRRCTAPFPLPFQRPRAPMTRRTRSSTWWTFSRALRPASSSRRWMVLAARLRRVAELQAYNLQDDELWRGHRL